MTKLDREAITKKYPIGCKVEGIIRSVWKLGVRIELDDDVSGVVRNQELDWDQEIDDARIFSFDGEPLQVESCV